MTDAAHDEHEPLDDLDRQILTELRTGVETLDPAPLDLGERMRFALTLAALEAEVAELQELSGAGVRSDTGYAVTDTVTFTSTSISLMVTVTPDVAPRGATTARVDGWVTGGGVVVELSVGGDRHLATSDTNGRLTWEGVTRGRARFLIHPVTKGARPVVTPTIEI